MKSILVIEREPTVRLIVKVVCELENYHVIAVDDSTSSVEALTERQHFDAFIIGLYDLTNSGLKILQDFNQSTSTLISIAIVNEGMFSLAQKARELGASAVISKRIGFHEELTDILKKLFEGQKVDYVLIN